MTAKSLAPARLWFGLLAAPAAWTVQGLCGWLFGARACTQLSVASIRVVLGGVSLAALAIAAAGIYVGLSNWRLAAQQQMAAEDRVVFMSKGGVLVSVTLLVGIAWASLNPLVIDVCGGAR